MGNHLISFGKFQQGILRMKKRRKNRIDNKTCSQKQEEGQPINPDLYMPNYREIG